MNIFSIFDIFKVLPYSLFFHSSKGDTLELAVFTSTQTMHLYESPAV